MFSFPKEIKLSKLVLLRLFGLFIFPNCGSDEDETIGKTILPYLKKFYMHLDGAVIQ